VKGGDDEVKEISLYDCLRSFTKQEQLGPEDPWYCSDCKDFRQAFKKFDVWSTPPILIIHLKRFSYRGRFSHREKLDHYIDFPIENLDLSEFVIGPIEFPPIYDLFAVSNHYGSLGGGHYTAYCKHRDDNMWYSFDDSTVRPLSHSSQVITSNAYVLFYRRRDLSWLPFDRSLDRPEPEEESYDTDESSSDDNVKETPHGPQLPHNVTPTVTTVLYTAFDNNDDNEDHWSRGGGTTNVVGEVEQQNTNLGIHTEEETGQIVVETEYLETRIIGEWGDNKPMEVDCEERFNDEGAKSDSD